MSGKKKQEAWQMNNADAEVADPLPEDWMYFNPYEHESRHIEELL